MKKFKYIKVNLSDNIRTEDDIIRYCENNNVELVSIFNDHFLVKEEFIKVLKEYKTVSCNIQNMNFLSKSNSDLSEYIFKGYEFMGVTDESRNHNCAGYYEAHFGKYDYISKENFNKHVCGENDIVTQSNKMSLNENNSGFFKIGEQYDDFIFLPLKGYTLGQMSENNANEHILRLRKDLGIKYHKVYSPYCAFVALNGYIDHVIKTSKNYLWVVKDTNDKIYVNKETIKNCK